MHPNNKPSPIASRQPSLITALLLLTNFLIATSLIHPAQAQPGSQTINAVGEITRFQGAGFAIFNGRYRRLSTGLKINKGERILTGTNTRVELTLEDGSIMTLGDFTDLAVSEYQFEPEKGVGQALFQLTKGAFRAITGRIGKTRNPRFAVRTPIATAGVRGTDFWGGLEFFDERLHVALLSGKGVYVENKAGKVEITEPNTGAVTPATGEGPEDPIEWGQKKMDAAVSSVSWDL